MRRVEVSCRDEDGAPAVLGNLVHMLTFTSDTKPLEVGEEDAYALSFSTARDGAMAERESNIVVGPICRAVAAEGGKVSFKPGKHLYRLLLVEVGQ